MRCSPLSGPSTSSPARVLDPRCAVQVRWFAPLAPASCTPVLAHERTTRIAEDHVLFSIGRNGGLAHKDLVRLLDSFGAWYANARQAGPGAGSCSSYSRFLRNRDAVHWAGALLFGRTVIRSPRPKGSLVKKSLLAGATAAALSVLFAVPAQAAEAAGTIFVPDAFDSSLSDTRANGSYEVDGSSLHLRTNTGLAGASTSLNKVAEYVPTDTLLSGIGEPTLDYTTGSGLAVGYQLVVDLDGDGDNDGILVGETLYQDPATGATIWWLGGHATFPVNVPTGTTASAHPAGTGSAHDGTLEQWRAVYPDAVVTAFGFSLGSGRASEGTLHSITFNGTEYTFTAPVVLKSKDECKDGGWATSTAPVFKNQGECVSSFASSK
jgi:hypothetical protein